VAQIAVLREQVENWRKTRAVNEHMPEPFWEAATELARVYGIAPVQGILRIDYRGLQRRAGVLVAPKAAAAPKTSSDRPRFLELPALSAVRRVEHSVELEDGVGRKVTLKVSGGNVSELLPLLQAFWRPGV
jgi:hypothetical protein